MQRLVNPGKRLPDKAGEPDFYEISRKYPLPQLPSATGDQDPALAGLSPHHPGRPGQPRGAFPFGAAAQAAAAGGYPYGGYYGQGPYPQMPSPAAGYGQPYPPQPPQQAYGWPNQMAMYPPNPYAMGYPYPGMMPGPQGFDPAMMQHPSMYGQYAGYPPGTPNAYANPASPGRMPPGAAGLPPGAAAAAAAAAAQGQPGLQPKMDPSQFYQSPGPRVAGMPGNEADDLDERKPRPQSGTKRSLDDVRGPNTADVVYVPQRTAPAHALEGSEPPLPHAASGEARSAQGAAAAYGGSGYGEQHPGAAGGPGTTAKAQGDGPRAPGAPGQARGGAAPTQGGGGDGINEQQLLQDFFQQY